MKALAYFAAALVVAFLVVAAIAFGFFRLLDSIERAYLRKRSKADGIENRNAPQGTGRAADSGTATGRHLEGPVRHS